MIRELEWYKGPECGCKCEYGPIQEDHSVIMTITHCPEHVIPDLLWISESKPPANETDVGSRFAASIKDD